MYFHFGSITSKYSMLKIDGFKNLYKNLEFINDDFKQNIRNGNPFIIFKKIKFVYCCNRTWSVIILCVIVHVILGINKR
jgi:hypothetical protein